MQTNERLFTDRNLHAVTPSAAVAGRRCPASLRLSLPEDQASGVLEALAHVALVLILLGALCLSGQHRPGAGSTAGAPGVVSASVVAGSSSPAAAVKQCL